MDEKTLLRKKMKDLLLAQSYEEREKKSIEIYSRVIELPQWKKASCIGITIAQSFEVETRQLIEKAWEEGKKVAVPKCIPETREMEFYLISSFHQLEKVYANLYEPMINLTEKVHTNIIELLITPGVAFTKEGDRLGFGAGYYDRFLAKYKGESVALSFDFQILQSIPINKHDKPVDRIITEKRIVLR